MKPYVPDITPSNSQLWKTDAIVFAGGLSYFFWDFFSYSWVFMVLTFAGFVYLFYLLFINYKQFRYIATGVASIMWGLFIYSFVYWSYKAFKREYDSYTVAIVFSLIFFFLSFWLHRKEFYKRYSMTEESKTLLNKNAKVVLVTCTIIYLLILSTLVLTHQGKINWDRPRHKGSRSDKPSEYDEVSITGNVQVYKKPSNDYKEFVGMINYGVPVDSLLAWVDKEKSTSSYYYINFNVKPKCFSMIKNASGGYFPKNFRRETTLRKLVMSF